MTATLSGLFIIIARATESFPPDDAIVLMGTAA